MMTYKLPAKHEYDFSTLLSTAVQAESCLLSGLPLALEWDFFGASSLGCSLTFYAHLKNSILAGMRSAPE